MASGNQQATAEVTIRPIEPADKDALERGFERLSEESRYRRFLAPRGPLTAAELRYLTEVDHHDHEALVAIDPASGEGVGVARFVRSDEDREAAEFAIAVVDDWQGQRVGSRLAAELAKRAREEHISCFTATALADNEAMHNLLRDLGDVRAQPTHQGTVELAVDLPAAGIGRLRRVLQAAACDELKFLHRRLRGRTSRHRREGWPGRERRLRD